ncbi:MAG: outer membrane protein assembly factor BamB family protein [Pirellulaceae bacterium]
MPAFLLLSSLLLAADSPSASVWPSFLGAGASPIVADSVPLEWAPDRNIAWKTDLPGEGQSSPVVWHGHVYLTTVEGPMKDTNHVLAFDLTAGQLLWKHSFPTSQKVEKTLYVSRAAPTSAADAQGVYAFFESGDLVALDHEGKVRWERSLTKDFGPFQNKFGIGSSLAQTEDAIIVLADHEGPSYALTIRKADGKNLWKTDRGSRVSWSSPAIVTVAGVPQLVISSAGSVDGYDLSNGKQLWTLGDLGGNTATTPIPFGDGWFLVGASPGEREQFASVAPKSNIAVRITAEGGKMRAAKVWTAEKALASFASPRVYQGLAYWVNQVGVVFCFDAHTGEKKFNARLAQSCWATPVGIGDRIYFFGKDGTTTVLAAGPVHKQLAVNDIWRPEDVKIESGDPAAKMFGGPIQYGFAVADGSFLDPHR